MQDNFVVVLPAISYSNAPEKAVGSIDRVVLAG